MWIKEGTFNTSTVVLKGKHQKKNVYNNPSMDSFTKINIDSEKLWPKIRELDLFQLTLQNDAKNLKNEILRG